MKLFDRLGLRRRAAGQGAGRTAIAIWIAFGVVVGVIGWGGFNTVMEATNRLEFCISCHEMRSTVHEEYETSIHHTNASGVRAICSDCHVPRDWSHKLLRKVQASRELFHWAIGSVDTKEKFEAARLDLARREWARMRASDSRECRNCHSYEAMDFHKQRPKSAEAMRTAEAKGFTCIDCHKGIAHKLPDLTGRHRAQWASLAATTPATDPGARLTTLGPTPFFAEAAAREPLGRLAPGARLTVRERVGDRVAFETVGWQREIGRRTLFARFGLKIAAAGLEDPDRAGLETLSTRVEASRDETWTEVRLTAWTAAKGLVADIAARDTLGREMNEANCSFCHALHAPGEYTAEKWISNINAMRRMVPLEEDELAFLLEWLQSRAKDVADGPRP